MINPDYPHIGASPDGIVMCDCCGLGILEIKCPYICRDQSFADAIMNDKTFSTDTLNTGHAYYYQVQAQIKLSRASYGDFVLWSPHELLTLRIELNDNFIVQALDNASEFFKCRILPELVGKWYTKAPVYRKIMTATEEQATSEADSESLAASTAQNSNEVWCYCKGKDEGEIIFCDSDVCTIRWFHTECLKLSTVPKGKWYCPDCRVKI